MKKKMEMSVLFIEVENDNERGSTKNKVGALLTCKLTNEFTRMWQWHMHLKCTSWKTNKHGDKCQDLQNKQNIWGPTSDTNLAKYPRKLHFISWCIEVCHY